MGLGMYLICLDIASVRVLHCLFEDVPKKCKVWVLMRSEVDA